MNRSMRPTGKQHSMLIAGTITVVMLLLFNTLVTSLPVVRAADRFYAQLETYHFGNLSLLGVSPENPRNTNPGDLPFDIVNASMLWYDIQVTGQSSPNLSIQPANLIAGQDLDSQIYLNLGLVPPNTTTAFDCLCLNSSTSLHAAITFDRGGEQLNFELNPFTTRAETLDAVTILLSLLGDTVPIPFGLGKTQAVKYIDALISFPKLVDAGKELIMAVRAPNAGDALEHAKNFYGDILQMANLAPLRASLATALDDYLSDTFDATLAVDLNNGLNDLGNLLGKARAIYHLATFLLDEALAIGGLLTSGYIPTVTLESVTVTPTNGNSPTTGPKSGLTPVTPTQGTNNNQGTNNKKGTSTDKSQWVSNSPAVAVKPGQQFTVNFTYANTGTTTWTDTGGYALVCDTYYHSNTNCMGGNAVGLNGQSVAPGHQYTFTVTLTAPSAPGTYTTWWDMAHHGSIFGANNAFVQVTVQSAPPPQLVDNSQWISNSPTMTVTPGQQFTVQFTYRNDGTTTWSDSGGYALSCDTFYHSNSNCMGGNPVGFNGQSVAPGQQYSFTFTLTAPSTPGTYTTWWDMTHSSSIFGNNNSYITVVVQTLVDNSQWISNSPTMTVTPGQQFSVQFTYQNDGTTTWSDSGGYSLRCDTYYHSNSYCMGGNPVGFNGQSVAPGQQYSFVFTLTAPSAPGTYTTWWDMTHNGSIFGNNNSYITVVVQTLVDNSQWVSNSSPVTVQPGQQFTIQFTYKNDGTTTWSDSGEYSLQCDTYYHSNTNCMGGSPVGFGGQSVAPGQQFTFTLTLVAPSAPGTYTTWWDMTHNGGIFGNNNSYVVVNVS